MNTTPHSLLVLNEQAISNIGFPLPNVIEVVSHALMSLGHPDSANPLKVIIEPTDKRSIAYSMAGRDASSDTMGFKVVYEFDSDRSRGNYQFYSFLFICDDNTGKPIALMDVKQLGPLRTSATSALFARAAAVPNANTVLLIGTGIQGQIALPMLLSAMPQLNRLIVHGSYQQGIAAVKNTLKHYFPERSVEESQNLKASAAEADIILAVTGLSAKQSICHDDIKPGAVVILVGYGIEKDVLHKSDWLITTDPEQMRVTADDLLDEQGKLPEVNATLTDILMGQKPARSHPDDIVFAYNSGMVMTDIALGRAIVDYSDARSIGQEVKLW